MSIGLFFYRILGYSVTPLLRPMLRRRSKHGKEDGNRQNERLAKDLPPRPPGVLVWLHGASIGESKLLLELAKRLQTAHPGLNLLLTTQTLTSAKLMSGALPPDARHQMAPIDTPVIARRFIRHWQPDLCVFGEGEIWPNLILEAQKAGASLALVNARMTHKSLQGWSRWQELAKRLLRPFDVMIASDDATATGLSNLLDRTVTTPGNLKSALPLPPADEDTLESIKKDVIGERRCILAASTHPGEEHLFLEAMKNVPDTFLILAPRHPDRAQDIIDDLDARGISYAQRSQDQRATHETHVLLADTIGEMGLWYRLADAVYLGGAHTPGVGGHNPLEAIRLSAPVVTGPDSYNFSGMMDTLTKQGLMSCVAHDASALRAALISAAPLPDSAIAALNANADMPMRVTVEALLNTLPKVGEKK